MKTNINQLWQWTAGILVLLFILGACTDENELGLETLPGRDLINVKTSTVKEDIKAYINNEFGIVANQVDNILLGSFNDPSFGNTTASLAVQCRLNYFPDFGTNPVVDSMFLYLYYYGLYGDTVTEQTIRVYEMLDDLKADTFTYIQDINLKGMASTYA
ncbi:MAG: DUF4270 family protein, partial [Draconibacterium sp.]